MTAKVPTIEIGTASSGMIEARQVCRNKITTSTTSTTASKQRMHHGLDRVAHEDGRVIDDAVIEPVREILLQFLHGRADAIGDFDRVGAGSLEDRNGHGRLVVEQRAQTVLRRVDLDAGHIAQPRHYAVLVLNDDLTELLRIRRGALRL